MDNDSIPHIGNWENKYLTQTLNSFENSEETFFKEKNSNDDESDDYRGRKESLAVNTKIIADEIFDNCESKLGRVKINCKLTLKEIKNAIKYIKIKELGKKSNIRYFILQNIMLISFLIIGFITGLPSYFCLTIFPIFCIVLMRIIILKNLKSKNLFSQTDFTVDIFSNKLEFQTENKKNTVYFDGTCKSGEYKNLIVIFSKENIGFAIPVRCIQPDLRADVQAMITAGCRPF